MAATIQFSQPHDPTSWGNPHVWRKFKQAERNMLCGIRARRLKNRRLKYWAREMRVWLEKLGI